MADWQVRQEMIIGAEKIELLKNSRVAVVGLGGVGGAAAEALIRAGVGHLFFIDGDVVSETNQNRQLIATADTISQPKPTAWKERSLRVNPEADVQAACVMIGNGEDGGVVAFQPDYVIDAIDTISAKLYLIELCKRNSIPLISCMGTGNRVSFDGFVVGDIEDTAGSGCPIARVLRKELHKRGIQNVKVLFNKQPPQSTAVTSENGSHNPGSMSYVPPIAGFMAAGYVIQELIK